jgi:hypothetical protein
LLVGAIVAAAALALSANASPSPSRQLRVQIVRTTEARSIDVKVFFPRRVTADCTRVSARPRRVIFPAVLAGAIRALLTGPTTAERRVGYGGWFSRKTAGTLRSVRIRHGVAYVDFRDFSRLIPNASSSCGSALLFAQLDRTVTQFPTVHRAVYSFNGSARAFYEWLQREPPAATP